MDPERCSYLVQRGQDQEAVQKSSYLQRAVPPPVIYSCSVLGFEGYHKRCLLRVPTCNDSQRPQSHHHRCTCGRGFRGKGRLAGVGPSPLRHVGKGGYPPPPPDGEVFRTDQQPTYHAHGVLWGIEFLLAPAPKPSSEGAPKRQ